MKTHFLALSIVSCAVAVAQPSEAREAFDTTAHAKRITVRGLEFPVVDVGSGRPVLFLHGFPDSKRVWRYQIEPFVKAGFRVIAPDLRGFGDAPRSPSVEDYKLPLILGDIIGLLDALDLSRVSVVGHDWGAVVAWRLAALHPQRADCLVALSVGAPGASGRDTIEQREKSWYMLFFQFEDIAESWLRRDDWKLFRACLHGQGDVAQYVQDLSRPGALTAGLNWYRANARPQLPPPAPPVFPKIGCPVMGVWSDRDPFLVEAQVRTSSEMVAGPWRYERISGAGHWMMLDKPDELNHLLLDFLANDGKAK